MAQTADENWVGGLGSERFKRERARVEDSESLVFARTEISIKPAYNRELPD